MGTYPGLTYKVLFGGFVIQDRLGWVCGSPGIGGVCDSPRVRGCVCVTVMATVVTRDNVLVLRLTAYTTQVTMSSKLFLTQIQTLAIKQLNKDNLL